MELWKKRESHLDATERTVARDRVAQLWIRAEVLRLTNRRAKARALAQAAGPEGSIGKLMSAELTS